MRARDLFLRARDLGSEELKVLLDQECGEDRALRVEVQSLLGYDQDDRPIIGDFALKGIIERSGTLGGSLVDSTAGPENFVAWESQGCPERIGPYRILDVLGHGGMGVVYRVEHEKTGRCLALKVLSPDRPPTSAMLERFRHEGRIAASISHPRCVFVFEADDVDGMPYIAMEAMPGRTLQHLVDDEGPRPVREAVDLILQALDGLEAAAEAAVVHRDVKPSNCFLDSVGEVKIGDFGISKSLEHPANLTQTGAQLGTPLYASPEQVRGQSVDLRTDMYSLGATLYFLLTGRPPFAGTHAGGLLAAIVADAPDPPRSLRQGIPRGLQKTVLRLLSKNPDGRYESYEHLRRSLLPFSSHLKPAPQDLRAVALFVDHLILSVICGTTVVLAFEFNVHTEKSQYIRNMLVGVLIGFPYFTAMEVFWRRSFGKALLGLVVTSADGQRASFKSVALRSLVFLLPSWLVLTVAGFQTWVPSAPVTENIFPWVVPSGWVGSLLLLSTIRRRNGFRGLHEVISGTRVGRYTSPRMMGAPVAYPESKVASIANSDSVEDHGGKLGPYVLIGKLKSSNAGDLYHAHDVALSRAVWLFHSSRSNVSVTANRAKVARPTRMRWLQGGLTAAGRWDAFEAPSGVSIRSLVESNGLLPWAEARWSLLYLARELRDSICDGTLPRSLDLAHIRVGSRGTLCLVDFVPDVQPNRESNVAGPVALIRDAAIELLGGDVARGTTEQQTADRVCESAGLFETLRQAADNAEGLDQIVSHLERIAQGSGSVSPRRRLVSMAPFFLWMLFSCLIYSWWILGVSIPSLAVHAVMMNDEYRVIDTKVLEASKVILACEGNVPSSWLTDMFLATGPHQRQRSPELLLRESREKYPSSTSLEKQTASSILSRWALSIAFWSAAGALFFYSAISALVSLVTALLFRGTIMMSCLGLRLVRQGGGAASRLRCAARSAATWLAVVIPAAVGIGLRVSKVRTEETMDSWTYWGFWAQLEFSGATLTEGDTLSAVLVVLSVVISIGGCVYAIRHPARGLQDRIAGTYLVPRETAPA